MIHEMDSVYKVPQISYLQKSSICIIYDVHFLEPLSSSHEETNFLVAPKNATISYLKKNQFRWIFNFYNPRHHTSTTPMNKSEASNGCICSTSVWATSLWYPLPGFHDCCGRLTNQISTNEEIHEVQVCFKSCSSFSKKCVKTIRRYWLLSRNHFKFIPTRFKRYNIEFQTICQWIE